MNNSVGLKGAPADDFRPGFPGQRTHIIRLPFQGFSGEQWLNLALAAVAALYVIYCGLTYYGHGVFDYLGVDYRSFFASGEIVRSRGFAQVYDLNLQDQTQLPIYQAYATGPWRYPFLTVPTPFLPLFVLPLQAATLFAPLPGFTVWSLLNFMLLAAYLARFARSILGRRRVRTIFVGMISFPVFWTLFFGQVNTWLVICLGEFTLRILNKEDLPAGMWLSGLLLKPQTLFLVIPGLLIGRKTRVLAGFAIGACIVALASLMLAGPAGLRSLADLIVQYSAGLPSNATNTMMNWRSAVLAIPSLASTQIDILISGLGMTLTSAIALLLWRTPGPLDKRQEVAILVGTLAATLAVAWHSHVHMAAPLVLLLLQAEDQGTLRPGVLNLWLLGPPMIFMAVAFTRGPQPAHQWLGVFMFFLNLILLGWAAYVLRQPPGIFKHPPLAAD